MRRDSGLVSFEFGVVLSVFSVLLLLTVGLYEHVSMVQSARVAIRAGSFEEAAGELMKLKSCRVYLKSTLLNLKIQEISGRAHSIPTIVNEQETGAAKLAMYVKQDTAPSLARKQLSSGASLWSYPNPAQPDEFLPDVDLLVLQAVIKPTNSLVRLVTKLVSSEGTILIERAVPSRG